jgi:hypothetical protein
VLERATLSPAGDDRLIVALPPASWNMVTFGGRRRP